MHHGPLIQSSYLVSTGIVRELDQYGRMKVSPRYFLLYYGLLSKGYHKLWVS